MESKNGDTDDQMSASYCFPRAGMFPGHCINTSSNSIERPCLVFEDLSPVNETHFPFGTFRPGTSDGCLFPFVSFSKYVPVPPPAVLSYYLHFSESQSKNECKQLQRKAFVSEYTNQNQLLKYGVTHEECNNDIIGQIEKSDRSLPTTSGTFHACYNQSHRLGTDTAVADVTMRRSRRQTLPRRRPYTASDLVSAVRAICLGQLGTRRAASVYGIPRSTLRNKICKLNEIKKHEEAACGGKPISLSDFIQQSNWAGKLSYDTSGSSGNDVRCSSAVESIFKTIYVNTNTWNRKGPITKTNGSPERMKLP